MPRRFQYAFLAATVAVIAVGLLAAAALGGRDGEGPVFWAGKRAEPAAPRVLPGKAVVPVLVYHNVRPESPAGLSSVDRQYDVTPADLREQMAYLKEQGFTPISFAALAAHLREGAPMPEKSVVISFDDGRRNQLENALPILDELGLKATFFVFTNAPDRNPNYFTWDEIRSLEAAGHEIGSHTRLHAYLTKADDETLVEELEGSQSDFEENLGHRVAAIAYPFGLSDDRVIAAASSAGFSVGRGLRHDVEVTAGGLMDVPGYIVTGNLDYLKKILAGEIVSRPDTEARGVMN
jgi:peptidoglycan/xylan/chitin deacetylase (PgdA/CDA1 family)